MFYCIGDVVGHEISALRKMITGLSKYDVLVNDKNIVLQH